MTEAMLGAAEHQRNALDRLKHAGLAYVAFAMRRPEHFAVMFDAPVSKHKKADAAEARERAFGTLRNFVKNCQDEGQLPSGEPLEFALLAWSMVHGIAKLAITGRLPHHSKSEVLKFAEFVINRSLPVRTFPIPP